MGLINTTEEPILLHQLIDLITNTSIIPLITFPCPLLLQEVPDELLELPYNASDSRHSLHNGNGPLMTTSSSNGAIVMVPAGSSTDCEDGYYQPVIDDTGQSAMIKIDVPTEVSRDEPRFPKEKLKTFYCE